MFSKKILTLLIFLLISLSNIAKVYSIEPDIFIQSTVNRAAKTLGGNLSKEERVEKLKEIARDTVDIKGLGYYSLGSYKKNLSDKQLKEYERVFEEYFLKSFSSRLAEYTDPKIHVDSQKKLNEKYTMVSSVLMATQEKPEVKINWRIVTKNPDKLLIIDVVIEGVSLAKVQKEEFNSIIQNNDGNINALLASLEEFVNK